MKRELAFALAAAREAGALTLEHFGSERLGVETKGDGSPVTRADREAERLLVERIRGAFPDDGILGEESGERPGKSGRRWILDPIDGTKSFIHGVPLYGTLVALEAAGRAVVGVICLPALGEAVYAARGEGAFWSKDLGGRGETPLPARVSAVSRLDGALMCTTSPRGFERSGHTAFYQRLQSRVAMERGWSDCYGHALVATGRAEIMLDPIMAIWDCAALLPVVEEAGGRFTDFSGAPTHGGGSAISTNLALADEVRALARG
jgi:histidinol phosphatase-like enzyme (inositol monophosphatase family)